jgi:hypothetical protein
MRPRASDAFVADESDPRRLIQEFDDERTIARIEPANAQTSRFCHLHRVTG